MPGISFQHLVVLGWLAVMIQKRPVNSEVELQDRKMFEVLLYAVYGEDFFDKSFPTDDFGPLGYSALVAVLGINLSDPASITITGRTDGDEGMNIAEIKGFQIGLEALG